MNTSRPPHSGTDTGGVAIVGVDILAMTGSAVLERDRTVVLNGDRIVRIGSREAVAPTGMAVVDGRGKVLMPGLADMHVHFPVDDLSISALFLANGVTCVRNMTGSTAHLDWQHRFAMGEVCGPRLYTTSPILDGVGTAGEPGWASSTVVTDVDEAHIAVEAFADEGYQQIKTYQWLQPDVLAAVGDAAHGRGLRVVGHCPEGMAFETAAAAGMDCFEHLTGIGTGHLVDGIRMPLLLDRSNRRGSREAIDLFVHKLDLAAIQRLAEVLVARGSWICPTLVVWQQAAELRHVATWSTSYETPGLRAMWDEASQLRAPDVGRTDTSWQQLLRQRYERMSELVAILTGAGVQNVFGTDAPNPFVPHGYAVHLELENLTSAGLSAYDVLRSATTDAARFVGGEWGTVIEGRLADLILVDANPLDDLATLRHPAAVFVNGCTFPRQELDRMLAQRASEIADADDTARTRA